jgi:hypothetical protein
MSFMGRFAKPGENPERPSAGVGAGAIESPELDPELERVLRDFRSSVRSWSDAAYGHPRLMHAAPRRTVWRMAAAWTLGSVLVAGGAWGGLLEYQHQQEQDRLARLRQQQYERQVQEERARQAEMELANVDRYVSQEVPDALEPLVPSMTADEGQ